MRSKPIVLAAAACAALSLGACMSGHTQNRALGGAGLGAAGGAAIGAVTGGNVLHGAAIGAGVGAVAGGVMGCREDRTC